MDPVAQKALRLNIVVWNKIQRGADNNWAYLQRLWLLIHWKGLALKLFNEHVVSKGVLSLLMLRLVEAMSVISFIWPI